MTKKGQINIGYKARRIGFNDTEKLVGQASRYSTIGYDAIVAYAAKAAAVPESSIEMAMEALFDAMNYFVLNGHSVQIPNLGTFSIGVRAKSTGSEAEFTADFANPGVFVLERVGLFLFLRPEKIDCFGAGRRFLEAVEAATHHELDKVALAAALQATVAPVAERIVEEQRCLFGGMERATSNQVAAPAAQGDSQLARVRLGFYQSSVFLV